MDDTTDAERVYDPASPLPIPADIQAAFPTKGVLHASLWWSLQTTHAPPIYHVGAAIAFGVLEMARRGWIINEDDPFVPAVWIVMVGDSGIAKSTVYKRYRRLYNDYLRAELAACWQRSPIIEGEGTIQGLIGALTEHYNRDLDRTPALLMLDEFTRFLRGREPRVEQLCRLIDQESVERHLLGAQQERLKTGKQVHGLNLVNPAVSGLFCTTPESLGAISDKMMVEGGLFSRLIWLKAGLVDFTPRHQQQIREGELRQVHRMWLDWSGVLSAMEWQRQRVVKISREVNEYLAAELVDPLFKQMSEGNRNNSYHARAANQVRTVASLYALSQNRAVMELDDVERAIAFAFLYLGYTRKINKTTAVAPTVALAERLLGILEEFKPKLVHKNLIYKHTNATKEALNAAIEMLLDQGLVDMVRVKTGKRGRPAESYKLADQDELSDQANGVSAATQAPRIAEVIPFPGQVTGNEKTVGQRSEQVDPEND